MTIGFASLLSAQAPTDPRAVQPERPTVATHAGTVAPGYLEIEAGGESDRDTVKATNFLPIVLKFGIASNMQLSVFSTVDRLAGTDLSVGVKWRLVEDAPFVGDFAILPAIKLPTLPVSKGGTGTTDVGLVLISSHKLGDIDMDLNTGITKRSGGGTLVPKTATLWTASFGSAFTETFGWVAEVYGFPGTGGPAGDKPLIAFLAGPTAQVHKWLAADLGLIIPVSGPQPHALYAGGVYNVGRLW
jgi:hypothetical protein